MAKKKKIAKDELISMYMEIVSDTKKQPLDIDDFCKEIKIKTTNFHEHFADFQELKTTIFSTFLNHTVEILYSSEDFYDYDARTKLLSFYYTFFELLTANRDYVLVALQFKKEILNGLKSLSGLRKNFKKFIESLEIETLDFKQEQLDKLQQSAISESAYAQLLLIIKFWIDDTSEGFEKTDILIEKSVNTSFEVLNIAPIKSVIDLAKFLYQEKVMKK